MLSRLLATPALLSALAVLPLLAAFAYSAWRRRRRSLAMLGNPTTIRPLITRAGGRAWQFLGGLTALVLIALAAAGPRWGPGPSPPLRPGCDVVLAVDLSRSMLARDALPNRFERAKEALIELTDAVQAHGGHRLGIVAFAGRTQVVCPLTHDYDHVRGKLAALTADQLPPALAASETSGTRIGAGLAAAVSAHDPQHRGAQMILLVSDGDDPARDEEWRIGSSVARAAAIPVFTLGVGDPDRDSPIPLADAPLAFRGSPVLSRLHESPLREIAARTGGTYFTAGVARPDMSRYVRQSIDQFPTRESLAGLLPQPQPRHAWFLAAALVLVILLLLPVPIFASRRLKKLAIPAAASLLIGAAAFDDAELRRGLAALDAGQLEESLRYFEAAAQRTTDPGLVAFNEGVALYRLDRFREAELRFRCALSDAQGPRQARALYNLGCALLQSSQARHRPPLYSAIASFQEALRLPDLDAELRRLADENLKLAERLLALLPPESTNEPDSAEPARDTKASPPNARDPARPGEALSRPGNASAAVPTSRDGKPDGSAPQLTDRVLPGKGTLPRLADDDVLTPLTPADAKAHLEKAAARIEAARQLQLRSRAPAPSTQFPDW